MDARENRKTMAVARIDTDVVMVDAPGDQNVDFSPSNSDAPCADYDAHNREFDLWVSTLPEGQQRRIRSGHKLCKVAEEFGFWHLVMGGFIMAIWDALENPQQHPPSEPPVWLIPRLYKKADCNNLNQKRLVSLQDLGGTDGSTEVPAAQCICHSFERMFQRTSHQTVTNPAPGFDNLIRAFYDQAYQGPAAKEFLDFLCKHENQIPHSQPPLHGRSVTVLQSSGTGKSRMVHELGFMGLYVMSLCLRPYNEEGRNGFPLGDQFVQDFFIMAAQAKANPRTLELFYCCYFQAFFKAAIRRLASCKDPQSKHSSWLELSDPPPSSPVDNDQLARLDIWRRDIRDPFLDKVNQNALATFTKIPEADRSAESTRKQAVQDAKTAADALAKVLPPGQMFVTAIDEASRLIEGLPHSARKRGDIATIQIRRVWMDIAQPNFWLLMMDTNSAMHHLAPQWEGSDRLQSQDLLSITPFTEFPPNVLVPEGQEEFDGEENLKQTPLEHASLENLKSFGRPLWSSLAISQDSQRGLVAWKVLGPNPGKDVPLVRQQILGLLCQRLELQFDSRNSAARAVIERQVHYNMRYIWGFSDDRTKVPTLTLTEPIPSLVAAAKLREVMGQPQDEWQICWPNAIKSLQELNSEVIGPIDVGGSGELVAQITLCVAFDQASRDDIKSKADIDPMTSQLVGQSFITFESFLYSLVGPSISQESEVKKLIKSLGTGYMRFTRVMDAECAFRSISEARLHEAWHRGVIWRGYQNQKDWDFLIPIYMGSLDVKFDPSQFTALAVQVKNRQKEDKADAPAFSPNVTRPERHDPSKTSTLATCSLWMEFGLDNDKIKERPVSITSNSRRDWTSYSVICRGISTRTYPCFEHVNEADLRGLLGQFVKKPLYKRNYHCDWRRKSDQGQD